MSGSRTRPGGTLRSTIGMLTRSGSRLSWAGPSHHRCNHHDALVRALEGALEWGRHLMDTHGESAPSWIKRVETVIKAAKGEA